MEIGISVFSGIAFEKLVECYKANGVKRTFLCSDEPDIDSQIACLHQNGIICETLHAPFDHINDMWKEEDAGEVMLNRLMQAVQLCSKHHIPVVVVHTSSGRPMPAMTDIGFARYRKLVTYAAEQHVQIAFENLRYLENTAQLLRRNPEAGFCWDSGHASCFTPQEQFLPLYGDRLIALHISDNLCRYDSDDHLLPFDGNIAMEEVAKAIADSGYRGTLMLEVGKKAQKEQTPLYASLTDDAFIKRAVQAAKKLAAMVEACKRE